LAAKKRKRRNPDSESGDFTDGKEKGEFGKQDLFIRVIREIRGTPLSETGNSPNIAVNAVSLTRNSGLGPVSHNMKIT